MSDTIFALSSGSPPAAIGIIRISGGSAREALERLAGRVREPRRATLRTLRDGAGGVLDRALVLWFDGPQTATGEELAEIHCHGGRAVVAAIEGALASIPGLRKAEPGEFTRRAFANGVLDLAEAEGLADLLAAETELQRLAAQASADGALSTQVDAWRSQVLGLSAYVEAALDFSDEDDVEVLPPAFQDGLAAVLAEIRAALQSPRAERLRDGIRVVLAGPPNAGKSSLFNALLNEGAAIVTDEAGTTRDVIERPVAFEGMPFVLIDTAGLRDDGAALVEAIGIDRARKELEKADIVLWLGAEGEGPEGALEIAAKCDLEGAGKKNADHTLSSASGFGLEGLVEDLVARARGLVPKRGMAAFNQRQAEALGHAFDALEGIEEGDDLLLIGERLRLARRAFDRLLGRQSTEEVLDALFGRFCIGK
ncbi:tRNA uridine-5-carboxymethylaminomethyl(34) synthesis GTPase MnmE [Qipengyuania aquimaris]|uniref:tRNA uridine-5-carboxymethylaminomethyl(34) synthesis GTPase MnmE n=1 Tax=Qipengyuania aquimaris TaxID=255984 RepID=UPI001CD38736|nr:tRNA uridine-5-carboxymethylaminomethyl(34) synthesis GTPase MnmE [Qipengyuania aquimaris]MCA0903460.1 tRNA uridine-5-carboxymethylaminomethyl(34) synthesis GTPase MnmE [Qipengyuania aquimaris]